MTSRLKTAWSGFKNEKKKKPTQLPLAAAQTPNSIVVRLFVLGPASVSRNRLTAVVVGPGTALAVESFSSGISDFAGHRGPVSRDASTKRAFGPKTFHSKRVFSCLSSENETLRTSCAPDFVKQSWSIGVENWKRALSGTETKNGSCAVNVQTFWIIFFFSCETLKNYENSINEQHADTRTRMISR